MENPYLRGLVVGPRLRTKVAWVWLALMLLVAAIASVLEEQILAGVVCIALALVVLVATRPRGGALRPLAGGPLARETQALELARLRGDVGEVIGRAHGLLRRTAAGTSRATAFAALAGCAEQQGDVRWARELYARALDESGWGPGKRSRVGAFMGPSLVARHAFTLAAEGRLDEANAELARASHDDEHPVARYLAVRAQALVLVRQRRFADALALLDQHRALLRYGANVRDRLLLHVMGAWSRASLEGTFRGALPELSGADPKLCAWVAGVLPEAASLVGGAS